MCIYWDTCSITVSNTTPYPLSAQTSPISDGSWDPDPQNTPTNASTTFGAKSECSLLQGVGGTANYILPDGTVIAVVFNVPYLAGNDPTSQGTANGPRSSIYTVKKSNEGWDRTHGGAGKAYHVTWTVAMAT